MEQSIYQYKLNKITGEATTLEEYKGKVLLIVNTASKCGLTPQYEGLEKLYRVYKDKGLVVLGFPANEFAGQEPGANNEIQEFCQMKFGIEFPMFEKVIVKGEGKHPLFDYLTKAKPEAKENSEGQLLKILKEKNLLSGGPQDIKWNFEKFLVNRKGIVVERFNPDVAPEAKELREAIEKELAESL
jgi:glutathione peroxidase